MPTIVLANDPDLLLLLQRSALTRGDIELLTAGDGGELLDRVTATRPALVVLTARVGTSSGADLAHRIKSDPLTAGIPVLLLANEDPLVPADAFSPAPGDREHLLAAVRRLLPLTERSWPRAPASLRVDYFVADDEWIGYTKDLGAGGLFLRARNRLEPGGELELLFDLPDDAGTRVRAGGRVVRAVEHDRDSHLVAGLGIEFVRIGGRDREAIRRFVARGARRQA